MSGGFEREQGSIVMDRVSQRSSKNRPAKKTSLALGWAKPKAPNLQVWTNARFSGPSDRERKLLRQLEAENAELRHKAIELVLQIQALRDGAWKATA
jgi:hypothetical protein